MKKNIYNIIFKILGNNLNGYLGDMSNRYLLGFFQWDYLTDMNAHITYHQKCSVAIKYFSNFFRNSFKSVIIATSLIVNTKKLNKKQLEYTLVNKGYILFAVVGV